MGGMKSISASIVVLAGALILASVSLTRGGTPTAVALISGALISVIGLIGWVVMLVQRNDPPA